MSNAYLTRMPSGIPGMVSRPDNKTIEPIPYGPANFPAFGLFGKIVASKFVPIGTGDAADAVYGLLIKPFPASSSQDALGVAIPPLNGVADVMRRGYATVKLNAGTAELNRQVYVRVDAASAGKPIGGIEAVADAANTIAIANCTFMGTADASGNVEIAYKI